MCVFRPRSFFPYQQHPAALPVPYPYASPLITAIGQGYTLVPVSPDPNQAYRGVAVGLPPQPAAPSPGVSSERRPLSRQVMALVEPQKKPSRNAVNATGLMKRLKVKKPKRVTMSAPVLQALQQPGGQFKLQQYELVAAGKLQQREQLAAQRLQEVELRTQPAEAQKQKQQQTKPPRKNVAVVAPVSPVVVSSVGSTTADAPVGNVPVAPSVSEFYPFYGFPTMTDQRDEASLILEPSSKAISGNGGTAISTPVSHAILKQGSNTKILFRPQSVAIVGANGRAHAQADLIVDYVNPEHRMATDVLKLPFYGGARGQILEIRKNSDGTVVSKILRGDEEDMELKVQQVTDESRPAAPAAPRDPEPSEASQEEETTHSFGDYLVNIQNAAASLVALQDSVKKTGKLSPDQRKVYTDNLEKLGVAAQKLAHIQQADDDHDAIRFLFDSPYETAPAATATSAAPASSGEKKKPSSSKLTFPGFKGKEENKKKEKEEEENVGEEGSGGDSVQVDTQEKESSIAEAKPVGLAIAGEGGVASSKPVATAVVGDGGLAVARPVATAIAGIKPSELGSLGLPISLNKKVLSKGKYGLVAATDEAAGGGVLVGPDYEARVAAKEIEAEFEDSRLQQQQQQQQQVQQAQMAHFDTEKFLANLRLKTAAPAAVSALPQSLAAYQPQSYFQQQQQQPEQQPQILPYTMADYGVSQSAYPFYPTVIPYYSWTPSAAAAYYPYQSAALSALRAYQLAQYNPYGIFGGYQPQTASLAQSPFQQYEYPQRAAALYSPSPVVSPAATYSNYNNYASFSSPSPYRFFYY